MTAVELRAALKCLGMLQGQLAEALGVHRVTVGRWVSGEAEVPRYVVAYFDMLAFVKASADAIVALNQEVRRLKALEASPPRA